MIYENLLVTEEDGVAEIVINRDESRNALSPDVRRELLACLESFDTSPSVRALILTGAGKAFCAGGSIKRFKEQARQTPIEIRAEVGESVKLFKLIANLNIPTIAAVNGHALGGGCGLAIVCDLTIAADSAKFGFPEITLGVVPALVSVLALQRLGYKKALELLMLGEIVGAAAAERAGLVNRVVPAGELMPTVRAMARRLAGFSPDALRYLRQLMFSMVSRDADASMFAAGEVSTLMRFSKEFEVGASNFLARGTEK